MDEGALGIPLCCNYLNSDNGPRRSHCQWNTSVYNYLISDNGPRRSHCQVGIPLCFSNLISGGEPQGIPPIWYDLIIKLDGWHCTSPPIYTIKGPDNLTSQLLPIIRNSGWSGTEKGGKTVRIDNFKKLYVKVKGLCISVKELCVKEARVRKMRVKELCVEELRVIKFDVRKPACFLGAVDNFCPWCQEPSVPAWDHLCWYCGAFDEVRPAIPQDWMQRRLGWPSLQSGHQFNAEVLAHMSSVRSKVLEKTWVVAVCQLALPSLRCSVSDQIIYALLCVAGRGTWQHWPSLCGSGVALGDTFLLRGRRGTYAMGWIWWRSWSPLAACDISVRLMSCCVLLYKAARQIVACHLVGRLCGANAPCWSHGGTGRSVCIVVIAECPALLSTASLGRPTLAQRGK